MLHIVLQSQDDILGLLGGDVDWEGVLHVRLPWLSALIVFVRGGGTVEPGCAGAGVGLFSGNTVGGVGGRHGFGDCKRGAGGLLDFSIWMMAWCRLKIGWDDKKDIGGGGALLGCRLWGRAKFGSWRLVDLGDLRVEL